MNNRPISFDAKPWLFLGLTLGFTWLFGFLGVALQGLLPRILVTVLVYGGGLAPLVVALWLTYRQHSPAFRKDYWRRVVDVRRIGLAWWGVILLFHPLKSLLAALIDVLMGGWGIAPEAVAQFGEQPLMILPTLVFWLLFGPIPEELGWRGYALDGLQARHGAAVSGLMIGFVWMLWHLPLFFVEETWQATHLGLGTQLFWVWAFSIIVESILYVWIYNNTGRSTLAAILFHFSGNAFGQLFALSRRAETTTLLVSVVTTILVAAYWGPKTLRRT
ncbi:MAG: CPBP family glutamic-type intramembrane protease [Anaerolineae bacterium]